jgi:peptidylprolyl isomerase
MYEGIYMKKILLVFIAIFACNFSTFCEEEQSDVNVADLSKAFGHLIGENLEMPGFKFDLDSIVQGMKDAVEGIPSPLSEEEYELAITQIQDQAFNTLARSNLEQATDFMTENSEKNNIIEVEHGKVQYVVDQEGSGPEVQESSSPLLHYTGKFIDGTVFSSTVDGDGPITLPLNQAIPGFGKGIAGMKEGEKRTVYIHPELGYGTASHLPPNSLLIFDVEVVKASTIDAPTENIAEEKTEEINLG